MESFAGRLAVVVGGGNGIGRALVRHLAAEGASVAVLDLSVHAAEETARLALADAPPGVRTSAHAVDVTDEGSLEAARIAIAVAHGRDSLDLLFNNAGIAGAGSFVADDRAAWERVFDVCWLGVYLGTRVFLPALIASDEGVIVNTASINAVLPVHGPGMPSTAYGSAKYAVKGFSEALLEDLRTHAPHVSVALVMPGSVGGTALAANSGDQIGARNFIRSPFSARETLARAGFPVDVLDDAQVDLISGSLAHAGELGYVITVDEAVDTILAGVREGRWRILTGIDAPRVDRLVRADPDSALDRDGAALLPPWLPFVTAIGALLDPAAVPAGALGFRIDGDLPVGLAWTADGVTYSASPVADAPVVVTDTATLARLFSGDASVDDAVAEGALAVEGDAAILRGVLASVRAALARD